jgi:hypothetical protein
VDLHALGYRSRLFLVLVLVLEKLSYVKPVAKQIEDEYEDEDDEKVAISKRI